MSLTPGGPLDHPVDELSAGAILGNDYRVLEVRRGGMGEVFIVRPLDAADEVSFALKSFQKRLFFVRECRQAFVQEVAIWMRLTGEPYIMPALGLVYVDDRPFVRMLFVPQTVRDLLRRGPLTSENAVAIAFQVAAGMRASERRVAGMVHGDLKPENLLVGDSGIFISDFGLARAAGIGQGSTTLETTWAYRAPEAWSQDAELSPATDIYAYGVVLHELMTGRRPFDGHSRAGWELAHRNEIPPHIDAGGERTKAVLAQLARRCLEKDPTERPAGFGAIFGGLNEMLQEADAQLAFTLLVDGFDAKESAAQIGGLWRGQVPLDLAKLGEFELALGELESWPEAERFVHWKIAHGDVLSMLGRDGEALVSLQEAAAAPDATDSERRAALLSLGLSLKRLDRFDEAIEIFKTLRRGVPDDELPAVLVNLATVYLDKGDARAVVALLQPLAPAHPGVAHLWANLGLAYEQLGDGHLALDAFAHALRVAPHMAELYVHRARVLMDDYGAFADAAVALDLAFEQGFDNREWYVRTRACCILLGDDRGAADLEDALRRIPNGELVDAMNAEAGALVERLHAKESE